MVFETLSIVYGVAVTNKELEAMGIPMDEGFPEDRDAPEINGACDCMMKIFEYPCCSKLNGKMFIIGLSVHTYIRRPYQCGNVIEGGKCYYYRKCDTCIGYTSNISSPHYDVDKILDNVVECDENNLCFECGHDNRKVMENGNCAWCNAPIIEERKNLHSHVNIIKERTRNIFKTEKLSYFYCLDDCLSCT